MLLATLPKTKPEAATATTVAEAKIGRAKKETEGFSMGTLFIFPTSAPKGRRVGLGTFRAVEGCQRVREPNLSPLLYKT